MLEKDCPDKLKILVTDKLAALHAFQTAHGEIQKKKKTLSNSELYELGVTAIEGFELNRIIYEELDYYKENGQILGNHPIFKPDILQRTVNGYTTREAMRRQANLRSYVSRDTKKLEAITGAEERQKFEAKLIDWKTELHLLDERLKRD